MHTLLCAHTHTHRHKLLCTHTYTHSCAHIYTHMHTCMCTNMGTCMHIYRHTRAQTRVHTFMHTHIPPTHPRLHTMQAPTPSRSLLLTSEVPVVFNLKAPRMCQHAEVHAHPTRHLWSRQSGGGFHGLGACVPSPRHPQKCIVHYSFTFYVPGLCMLSNPSSGSLHAETAAPRLSSDSQVSKEVITSPV